MIFVSNNMMAMGCVKALLEMDVRIPQDMAIIGFDDIELFDILNLDIMAASVKS